MFAKPKQTTNVYITGFNHPPLKPNPTHQNCVEKLLFKWVMVTTPFYRKTEKQESERVVGNKVLMRLLLPTCCAQAI